MKSHVIKSIRNFFLNVLGAKDFIKSVDEHLLSYNKALASTLIEKALKKNILQF